jgi:hypothetical protein
VDAALFDGTPSPLPDATSRRHAVYRPASEGPTVIHASGYAPFVHYARTSGSEPAWLAGDLTRLLAFLTDHPGLLDDEALLNAAGIFFGNVIATNYPPAQWRVLTEPEIVTRERGIAVVSVLRLLMTQPEHQAEFLRLIAAPPPVPDQVTD